MKIQRGISFGEERIFKVLDYTGLILIGVFSLAYCIFVRKFAELHINLPFLNFPIFVGEILLFFCLILLLIKLKYNPSNIKLGPWHYLLFCWTGFILLKALFGYLKWGPLALRHSALFYYPIFTIFGFNFYDKEFFKNKALVFLFLILIINFHFIAYHWFALITCLVLCIVLLRVYMPRNTRNLLFIILFLFLPYKLLFYQSRTFLISNIAALLFVASATLFVLKIKTIYKIILTALVIVSISFGIFAFADKARIMSLQKISKYSEVKHLYDEYNKLILVKRENCDVNVKKVKIYNPEVDSAQLQVAGLTGEGQISADSKTLMPKADSMAIKKVKYLRAKLNNLCEEMKDRKTNKETSEKAEKINKIDSQLKILTKKLDERKISEKKKKLDNEVKSDINEFFFRIFIWRDMFSEFRKGNILFGRDFGEPFRSISLEVLDWASGEWRRDGWITAHNSYLEIIYRTGITGIIYVLIIFIVFLKMIKRSISIKSITGICLCGALINWLIAANALVIFELPYNAIPFWSLFGMTFAYLFKTSQI